MPTKPKRSKLSKRAINKMISDLRTPPRRKPSHTKFHEGKSQAGKARGVRAWGIRDWFSGELQPYSFRSAQKARLEIECPDWEVVPVLITEIKPRRRK